MGMIVLEYRFSVLKPPLMKKYPTNKKQWVLVDGDKSPYLECPVGVPLGSILRSYFLYCINVIYQWLTYCIPKCQYANERRQCSNFYASKKCSRSRQNFHISSDSLSGLAYYIMSFSEHQKNSVYDVIKAPTKYFTFHCTHWRGTTDCTWVEITEGHPGFCTHFQEPLVLTL